MLLTLRPRVGQEIVNTPFVMNFARYQCYQANLFLYLGFSASLDSLHRDEQEYFITEFVACQSVSGKYLAALSKMMKF